MSDDDTPPAPEANSRCPICRKPTAVATRPFCSKHCADIDLLRWMNGSYAIAGSEDDDEDGESAAGANDEPPPLPRRRH